MKIGYMRISKGEQTTALQEDALAKAECEKTFRDVMSGAKDDRPQFLAMLEFARSGDTIVVWRLDRLGRSLRHLIDTVMDLQAREINFLSLTGFAQKLLEFVEILGKRGFCPKFQFAPIVNLSI